MRMEKEKMTRGWQAREGLSWKKHEMISWEKEEQLLSSDLFNSFFFSFFLFSPSFFSLRFLFLVINTGCCHSLPTLIFCFVCLGGERERKKKEEERLRKKRKKEERRRIKYHPKWSKECFNSLNNKIQSSSFSLLSLLSFSFCSRRGEEEKLFLSSILVFNVCLHTHLDWQRKKEGNRRKEEAEEKIERNRKK